MNIAQLTEAWGTVYRSYGYRSYSMSKFEEYELYLRNKDFLITDRVLTFTDTDGKLMALKPDVTLSIIKNTEDVPGGIRKVYYQEHVYRPGKSDQGFREIPQVGLECMGNVDSYCVLEVLLLAVRSLQAISERCALDISHMGLLSGLLDSCGLTGSYREKVLEAIGSKNPSEIRRICSQIGAPWEKLEAVARLGGPAAQVLPALEEIFGDEPDFAGFKQLLSALEKAGADCVNVDFSVINDMKYYNGIVFRGFVEGVPTGVLSGGQYDGLMQRMKRRDKAIGFALYPELLERLGSETVPAGVDVVLFYEQTADPDAVRRGVQMLIDQGLTVCAQPGEKSPVACKKCCRLIGNEVKYIEDHA